jgi:hypothetical protein
MKSILSAVPTPPIPVLSTSVPVGTPDRMLFIIASNFRAQNLDEGSLTPPALSPRLARRQRAPNQRSSSDPFGRRVFDLEDPAFGLAEAFGLPTQINRERVYTESRILPEAYHQGNAPQIPGGMINKRLIWEARMQRQIAVFAIAELSIPKNQDNPLPQKLYSSSILLPPVQTAHMLNNLTPLR